MVRELIRVVYIWSSLLQLTRDLSQAEKKILLLQAEQSHKMATVFTHTGPWWKKLSLWVKSVVSLWMCSACNKSTFEINPVIQQSTEADYTKCRPPSFIFEWKLSRPEEIQLWLRCSSSLIWNRTLNPRLINKQVSQKRMYIIWTY